MSLHGHRSLNRPVDFPGLISFHGPMVLRGLLVLLIGTAGWVLATLWPAPRSNLDPLVSAAPGYDVAPSALKRPADDDGAMVVLRRQAGSALSQLRTQTTDARR